MNQLDAALIALAHREGRAIRSAGLRHRRIVDGPMVVSPWQLGSEPFSAAAIAFGDRADSPALVVAGDPRSRDLSFAALLEFAAWFLPRFEGPAIHRETLATGGWAREVSTSLPQVVVPNRAAVELLDRLGRRLAYLPTDGDQPAPPELVRLGQHFQFLARHAAQPGQQLIVSLAEVMAAHWVTPQTDFERASLAALDAFIEPQAGLSGFDAAAAAEQISVGPTPSGDDDRDLEPLVADFNTARARRTDPAVIGPLLGPITAHYRRLVAASWPIIWRSLEREREVAEAPSVAGRWDEDRREYVRHIDWLTIGGGRRRTRQTSRQAIDTMRRLEEAKARLISEEAIDDPLRMIPYLLDGKAVEGEVMSVDLTYQEVATVRTVRRPLVTILSESERPLPVGKKLWATNRPAGPGWIVHRSIARAAGGTLITLKLATSNPATVPAIGASVCFSVHNKEFRRSMPLPAAPPWPMRPVVAVAPASIEIDGSGA